MTTMTKNNIAETSNQETTDFRDSLLVRLLWVALAVSLSAAAYFQFTRMDVLPIEQVKISGEFNQIKAKDLQVIVAEGIEGNFFTVDVEGIYQELIDLPWVEKAWIHRIWPNTIKISLQEQQPIAILENAGLMNQYGEIFSRDIKSFENTLPLFIVAKNYTLEPVVQYQKIQDILKKNKLQARVFYYDERKSQTIKLTSGIEIILGRVDIEKRLTTFVKAHKTQLQYDKRKIETVDLRYTNGLAVKWVINGTRSLASNNMKINITL